ncbi:MAG TPA: hypothetical protein PLK94_13385 [Alphaproteobacteria bacterium]|nr:hypothetical protein [Alphaproteobacteria bacterium]
MADLTSDIIIDESKRKVKWCGGDSETIHLLIEREWCLIALTHNLDRIYRAGKAKLSQASWKEQFQMG